jgi:hypothetical protein
LNAKGKSNIDDRFPGVGSHCLFTFPFIGLVQLTACLYFLNCTSALSYPRMEAVGFSQGII